MSVSRRVTPVFFVFYHSGIIPETLMGKEPIPQKHPQERRDREVLSIIAQNSPDDPLSLAELARLRIRYEGFPGAIEIKETLDQILQRWNLTEAELFAKTREIHQNERIYQVKSKFQPQEDWT
jgi:hypothetical protein